MSDNRTDLTPLQRGMLFNAISRPEQGIDIEQIIIRMDEPLDVSRFVDAWVEAMETHEMLRASFRWNDHEDPSWVDSGVFAPPLHVEDLRQHPDPEASFEAFLERDRVRGFELDRGPLLRLSAFRLGEARWWVVWTFHHGILDGRSFDKVLRQVLAHYDSEPVRRSEAVDQRAYVRWWQTRPKESEARFWRQTLDGFTPKTTGVSSPADGQRGFGKLERRLPKDELARLQAFARDIEVSLHTLMQGVWSLWLHHTYGLEDVVFGSVRACRHGMPGLADTVGMLMNTVPVRVRMDGCHGGSSVRDWLGQIRASQTAIRPYEQASIPEIQSWLKMDATVPLVQSLLVHDHAMLDDRMKANGFHPSRSFEYRGNTGFAAAFSSYGGERLTLRLQYDKASMSDGEAQKALQQLETLLMAMTADADANLRTVHWLDARVQQRARMGPSRPVPTTTWIDRFLQQVAERPRALALAGESSDLTYEELEARSAKWARTLRHRYGVGAGSRVAVHMDRGPDVVTALVAIVRSGATYVPLDVQNPAERTRAIMDAASPSLVVSHCSVEGAQTVGAAELDSGSGEVSDMGLEPVGPDDLAYVIFTSGSTGVPKGVVISHRSLAQFIDSAVDHLNIEPGDRLLSLTTPTFDVAMFEYLAPLAAGATVHVAPEEWVRDAHRLRHILEGQATLFSATPATYRMLLDAGWQGGSSLRCVTAGEPIPGDLAEAVARRCGRLVNAYGPTEATVYATWAELLPGRAVTIGVPLPNLRAEILDAQGRSLPAGWTGELWLGGPQLSAGYLNDPNLTATRFVTGSDGDRLYATGDLARVGPDGELLYLGRKDLQVKLRGYRIELGDVEAALRRHPRVRDAAVVVRGEGLEGRLVAFWTGESDVDLAAHARGLLPSYMVPSLFQHLAELPLSASAKVDRNRLPQVRVRSRGVPPETEIERALAPVWAEATNGTPVDVTLGFFEAGGTSLSALRLFTGIEARFGRRLPLSTIVGNASLREVAQKLGGPDVQHPVGPVPLAHGRHVNWFAIHDGDGEVLPYRALSERLAPHVTTFGIMPVPGDGVPIAHTRIETMAKAYADQLVASGSGPHWVGGLCAGGMIALEVVRCLEVMGQPVAGLVLLDATAPGARVRAAPRTVRRWERLKALLAEREGTWTEDLRHRSTEVLRRGSNVVRYEVERQWTELRDRTQVTGLELLGRTGLAPPDWLRSGITVRSVYLRAKSHYRFEGQVHAPVFLVRATEAEDGDPPFRQVFADPDFGWSTVTTGPVTTFDAPGGHASMLQAPNVDAIATWLLQQMTADSASAPDPMFADLKACDSVLECTANLE